MDVAMIARILGAFVILVSVWQTVTPASASTPRGVHIRLFGGSQRDYRAQNAVQFDAAAGLHASMMRAAVSWRWLEQNGKGQYSTTYLAWLDSVVTDANARGVRPVFVVYQSPCWASADPARDCVQGKYDPEYPPSNPDDYGDALAFLAARYETRVAGWEIWNEPNWDNGPRWAGGAAQYAALVKAARAKTTFHPLIGGAVSGADVAYLEQLYDAGALGSWDVFSFHVYPATPETCNAAIWSLVCGAPAVHETMLARGDTSPIWITEIGYKTPPTTLTNQAAYLTRTAEIIGSMPYVDAWFWYMLIDDIYVSSHYRAVPCCWGLLDSKGRERPAAAAFRGLP